MLSELATTPLRPRAILLDTNVWINSQLGSHPGFEDARKLLVYALEHGIRIGIAYHSLKDVFYVVSRELKRENDAAIAKGESAIAPNRVAATVKEAAWGIVNSIAESAEIVGGDASDVHIAASYKPLHDDYEDNLILAAARRMGAGLIVSDDTTFVRRSPLPALSTTDALAWISC